MRTNIIFLALLVVASIALVVGEHRQPVSPNPQPTPSPTTTTTITPSISPTIEETGTLQGTISIGPNCPVERVDQPCTPGPEQYQAHPLLIYRGDVLIQTVIANSSGHYAVHLAPGIYRTIINKNNSESSTSSTTTVTIQAGETVTVNVSIDTGIR